MSRKPDRDLGGGLGDRKAEWRWCLGLLPGITCASSILDLEAGSLRRASTTRDLDMGWKSLTQVEQDTNANGNAMRELPSAGEQIEGHVCLEVAHREDQSSQFDTTCPFEEKLKRWSRASISARSSEESKYAQENDHHSASKVGEEHEDATPG